MAKGKHKLKVTTLVLSLQLVLLPCLEIAMASTINQHQQKLQGIQSQIEKTRRQISQARQKEKSVLNTINELELAVKKSRSELEEIELDYQKARQEEATITAQYQATQAALAAARTQMDQKQNRLSSRLRAIYQTGVTNYLELLFKAESFGDFLIRLDLLERIAAQDAALFRAVKAEKQVIEIKLAEIERLKTEISKRRERVASLRASRSRQVQNLAQKQQEQQAYLRKLQSERELFERALDEMEAESRRLEQIIRELQRGPQARKPTPAPTRMIWPVQGRISSPYGWRIHPVLKTRRFHSGLDIAVPTGTPVKAAANGVVILSGWVSGYGNTVVIDHGGGISTLYGHNSALTVKVGQEVVQGQVIARAGSTGMSTGPHVHFEVRQEGTPIDPGRFLP